MLAAPSTEVGSIPSFIIIAANGVPARIDWPTMTCFHPVSSPWAFKAGIELVEVHRTIQTAADVVLPRPLQLDRRSVGAVCLGDRYRLHDVVRPHVGAPAEAAARIERMDEDLLGLESRDLRRVRLIHGLKLIARPDLAAVGGKFDHRVEGLHGRMRQIRKFVAGGNLVSRIAQSVGGVSVLARRAGRLLGEPPIFRHQFGGAALLGMGFVPMD